MRAAIFIEDGTQQIVLTPENEWERNSLKAIEDKTKDVATYWGSFYECNGGWMRQSSNFHSVTSESSLIFRITAKRVDDSRS